MIKVLNVLTDEIHISYPHISLNNKLQYCIFLFLILSDIQDNFKFVLFHKLSGQHAIEELVINTPKLQNS